MMKASNGFMAFGQQFPQSAALVGMQAVGLRVLDGFAATREALGSDDE
jgi:hypothetical protein